MPVFLGAKNITIKLLERHETYIILVPTIVTILKQNRALYVLARIYVL